MLHYTQTPIQRIEGLFLEKAGVRLLIKREDLNHPFVSGNKWWKLKYNLEQAISLGHKKVLTFGGAYSNHIYATAAATRDYGLESIGIIRGEKSHPVNPILSFAESQNMQLHYISREAYRKKSEQGFIENLTREFGDFYLIPEGGTNALAVKGCEELGATLMMAEFDYLCLPVGTGGTMAGIIAGMSGERKVIGYSVLKGGEFLKENVGRLVFECAAKEFLHWSIETTYHFGGYAKATKQLLDFMDSFQIDHNIALDPVYTAKMLFGVVDQIRQNKIERGSTILGAAYRRYSRVGIRKAVNAKAIFKQPSPYVR